MPNGLSGFIKAGLDILTTSVNRATGKILAQLGSVTEKTGNSDDAGAADHDNVEMWQHVGWASRPSKPSAGQKAAQGLVLSMGDHDICFASQDVRSLDQYGNLGFGEFCAYAAGEDGSAQARIIGKGDGSIALFSTDDNTKDGKSVYFRVAPDGFIITAPWGTIRFDATGFHILHQSGASFNLGGIGGIPGLESVIGSYIKMQAASVTASSVGMPLADAPSTILALTALQAQITALQAENAGFAAAWASLAANGPGPLTGAHAVAANAICVPTFAAGTAAVVAGTAAAATQLLLIPKGSGMT